MVHVTKFDATYERLDLARKLNGIQMNSRLIAIGIISSSTSFLYFTQLRQDSI